MSELEKRLAERMQSPKSDQIKRGLMRAVLNTPRLVCLECFQDLRTSLSKNRDNLIYSCDKCERAIQLSVPALMCNPALLREANYVPNERENGNEISSIT